MSEQKSTQDNCMCLHGWQSASETQKANISLGSDFFTSKNKQCLSAAVFVPWGKPDRIPRNTFSTDLNVINYYLGEAINAQLFPGLPLSLRQALPQALSPVRSVKCEHVTNFIPRHPNQESQAFQSCTKQARGSRWDPAPRAVLGAKQEGPHVKTQFHFLPSHLFAWFLMTQSPVSGGLLRAVPFVILPKN